MDLAREKARYDKISYASADVERITAQQNRGDELFAQAHAAFDSAEEAQIALARPTAADYESFAVTYQQAQRLAEDATEPVEEAERMRAELDSRGPPSTGVTRRMES